MKIEYKQFGGLIMTAEDGRDVAWLDQIVENMSEDLIEILSNFFTFTDQDGEQMDLTDKKEVFGIHGFEFNPFGELASPYNFATIKNAYDKTGMGAILPVWQVMKCDRRVTALERFHSLA
jgi:hypothetical protein